MRGLIIREPWIDLILDGKKTWEIRSRTTKIRGRIALIRGGSGTIVGYATLVDSIGPQTIYELSRQGDKHGVPDKPLREFVAKYENRAHAWVLKDVERLESPIPYNHPSGAVIWVNLDEG